MTFIWKDWPTLEDQRRAMQTSNPDRTVYDPRGLTRAAALDPMPASIDGYLNDAGELVRSGTADMPRVRINTESYQKGGYKRDETIEFPALALSSDEDEERALETLDRFDRLTRRYVALKEKRDREQLLGN